MKKILLFILLLPISVFAQGYTSYFTGSTTNITTTPEFGVCLMGGATEHDNAMIWLLQKANGGDVVVLRSSGSDGYNDYLYSELGVNVNSVETLVITSVAGATNAYVLDKVANAEMIWFAGGDQYNYVSYFKDNALEDLINNHINVKHAPIGGTSAGMAILGGKYFSAQNGSVTSAAAQANPYNTFMTIGSDDFLSVPLLSDVITDTHYDDPDRRGRHSVFIGRLQHDTLEDVKGIACNEYVAVCIGSDGIAHVYGDYPNYQEFAFFIQPNCENPGTAEICAPGSAMTWNYGGQAMKVYKVPGTMNGANYFDVNVWENGIGSGGSWEHWAVDAGVFATADGTSPDCELASQTFAVSPVYALPNPFANALEVKGAENASISICDVLGKVVYSESNFQNPMINTTEFSNGLYFLTIVKEGKTTVKKLIKN